MLPCSLNDKKGNQVSTHFQIRFYLQCQENFLFAIMPRKFLGKVKFKFLFHSVLNHWKNFQERFGSFLKLLECSLLQIIWPSSRWQEKLHRVRNPTSEVVAWASLLMSWMALSQESLSPFHELLKQRQQHWRSACLYRGVGTHRASHSPLVSNRLALPPQPPYQNCRQACSFSL